MNIKLAYESGISAIQIAKEIGVSSPTIYKRLRASGVKIRTISEAASKELVKLPEILAGHDSGRSVSKLAKQYGFSITGMSNLLKRNNRKILRPEDIARDWSFVERQNNLFFYWLGWMLSDGCIYYKEKDGRTRGITTYLTVDKIDTHILEFFREAIQPSATVGSKRSGYARKHATGKNMRRLDLSIPRDVANIVRRFGFIPNKTYDFVVTDKLRIMTNKQFYQFLCGLIEGDGCIENRQMKSGNHIYPMRRVRIYNHPNLIIWIKDRLALLGFDRKMIDCRPKSHMAIWGIAGRDADKLLKKLLDSQYHLLTRKWDHYTSNI